MERVTLRPPKQQLALLNSLVLSGEFPSKSAAIRAAVPELVNNRYNKLRTEKERFFQVT